MPKNSGTRKQRAAELFKRLEEGPAFGGNPDNTPITTKEARERYNSWVRSWVLPELKALVPELKKPADLVRTADNRTTN